MLAVRTGASNRILCRLKAMIWRRYISESERNIKMVNSCKFDIHIRINQKGDNGLAEDGFKVDERQEFSSESGVSDESRDTLSKSPDGGAKERDFTQEQLKEREKGNSQDRTRAESDIQRRQAIPDEEVRQAILKFVNIGNKSVNKKVAALKSEKPKSTDEIDGHQFDSLAGKLSGEKGCRILPERFVVAGRVTPYEQLSAVKGENPAEKRHSTRISVTSITPKSWCELQRMYFVYSGVTEKPATAPMIRGSKEHLGYEHHTHPQKQFVLEVNGKKRDVHIEETHTFAEKDKLPLERLGRGDLGDLYTQLDRLGERVDPSTKELAGKWASSILRFLSLFQFGECREVLVNALYDVEGDRLLDSRHSKPDLPLRPSDYIIVSGIIDHLKLESGSFEGAFEAYQEELKTSITDALDISDLIEQIAKRSRQWANRSDPMLYMTVKDIKTRRTASLPAPPQIESAISQVGMYRKFLEILSLDPEVTYHMMIANALKRGIDPYVPLPQAVVFPLCLQNNYLIKDFARIKHGKAIGFKPYDQDPLIPHNYLSNVDITLPQDSEILSELVGSWEEPPTLAYMAARLAQLYNLMNPFFSDIGSIEYSNKGSVFRQINCKYNEAAIDNDIMHGIDLWMGKREPAHPFFPSICKRCIFRKQCEWHLKNAEGRDAV